VVVKNYKLYKNFLRRRRELAEKSFYKAVDSLQQFLGEAGLKNVPYWCLTEFSIFKDWKKGKVESYDVWDKMDNLNLEVAARNKIMGRVKKYLDTYYLEKGERDPVIESRINFALKELENKCLPDYIKYLTIAHKYFEKLVEIDYVQVPILHAKNNKNGDLTHREITLNQAINYIKYNKLKENSDSSYITNKYVLTFEKHVDVNKSREQTRVKTLEWFLAPNGYIEKLINIFNIRHNINIGNHKTFYNNIGESLKGGGE